MDFTNFSSSAAVRALCLVALAALPLMQAGFAGDPYQPVRGLVAALCVAVLLAVSRPRGPSRRLVAPGTLLLLLLVVTVASAAASGAASSLFGVHGRYQGVLTFVLFAVTGLSALFLEPTGPEARLFSRALGTVLLVEAVIVLAQRLAGLQPVGSMGNAVLAAGWTVTAASFVLGASAGERGRWRVAMRAAGLLGVAAVGALATRGAWLAMLAALALIVLVGRMQWRHLLMLGACALVLGVLLAGTAAMNKLSPTDLVGGSAGSRMEIWRGTARMVVDYPVLGIGPGRFLYVYPRYQSAREARIESGDTRADQAHSVYLQQAAETGVVFTLAFVALIIMATRYGLAAARRGDALALAATAGLFAWSCQALFGISTIETDVLAWFCGGLALSRGMGDAAVEAGGASIRKVVRFAALVTGLLVAALCVQYLRADVAFSRSVAEFAASDFVGAYEGADRAVSAVPTVDTFRIALADAAMYRAFQSDAGPALSVRPALERGLELEPASYDLAASLARLLASMPDSDPTMVWDAYVRAMELYPMGVSIRREAWSWAQRDGTAPMQSRAAAELKRVNDLLGQ